MSKFWYLITILCCPICFKERTYKKRQYTKRPENHEERYRREDSYDYCDV